MKKYLLAILIFYFPSCEKFESPIYSSIQIEVRNEDGTDLLNPNNADAYKVEGIKLFDLEGGILKEIYNENLALPRNFSIQQDSTRYWINIFPSTSSTHTTTYIQWDKNDIDTIVCDISKPSEVCTKVWFNGKLRWQTGDGTRCFFQIIK